MRRLRIGIGITAAAILCACGSPGAVAVATPTPSPVASPVPSPEPSPAPQPPLVMVPSADGKQVLVESFADPANPLILYSLSPNVRNARFISRTEVGYAINSLPDSPTAGVTEIWRMSLTDMRPASVVKLKGSVLDFAWSRDGANFAYMAQNDDGGQLWMMIGTGAPRALTPVLQGGGREGTSYDESLVRFSYDGKYLLMVNTGVYGQAPKSGDQAMLQVRSVPDGKLVWVPPTALKESSWTTMAAWSHLSDRLYYSYSLPDGQQGVLTWDAPATVATFAGTLSWSSPSVSSDDRLVAYEIMSFTDQKPKVGVHEVVSGTVRTLPGNLGRPTWLSDQLMIETHMVLVPSPMGAYWWHGQYYLFDLQTNVETALPTGFEPIDVWVG